MSEETILRVVIAAIAGLGSVGSLVAWRRFTGEKRSGQLIIKAAEGAVVIQGGVLKTLNDQIDNMIDEITQMKMENSEIERKHGDCEKSLHAVRLSVTLLQHDLASHSRMSELARRKTHVAINALGNYELLIEAILTELRNNHIPVTDDLRPAHIRENFQAKMNALEELESRVTQRAVEADLSDEEVNAAFRSSQPSKG